jgi:hypothetical protein
LPSFEKNAMNVSAVDLNPVTGAFMTLGSWILDGKKIKIRDPG